MSSTRIATYFFVMLNDDASSDSRIDYFDWHKFTAYGLGLCGFSLIPLKWIEWSHPPTWTIVAWILVGLFNYYHWQILADYADVDPSNYGSSKVELMSKVLRAEKKTVTEEETVFVTNKMQ